EWSVMSSGHRDCRYNSARMVRAYSSHGLKSRPNECSTMIRFEGPVAAFCVADDTGAALPIVTIAALQIAKAAAQRPMTCPPYSGLWMPPNIRASTIALFPTHYRARRNQRIGCTRRRDAPPWTRHGGSGCPRVTCLRKDVLAGFR